MFRPAPRMLLPWRSTGLPGNYALRGDGTVVGWSGYAPPVLSNIVAIAAGNNFALALRAEGSVVGWGNTPYSTVPAGLNHVTAIACGNAHSLALRSDGTVVAWGTGAGDKCSRRTDERDGHRRRLHAQPGVEIQWHGRRVGQWHGHESARRFDQHHGDFHRKYNFEFVEPCAARQRHGRGVGR